MSEKKVGYSLLVAGLIIMVFAVFQIIMVFTGSAKPIKMFQADEKTQNQMLDTDDFTNQLNPNAGAQPQIPNFLESESVIRILNLSIYYFIMQFLLGFGYKLSSLGVQMIRPLKIEMKHRDIPRENTP